MRSQKRQIMYVVYLELNFDLYGEMEF